MNSRTPLQRILLIVGAVVLAGGLVCLVAGTVASDGRAALLASGGFAAVAGLAIIGTSRG